MKKRKINFALNQRRRGAKRKLGQPTGGEPVERKSKECGICERNANDDDHVEPKTKKMRWCYEKQARICPLTQLEVVQGKECHYCCKAHLS